MKPEHKGDPQKARACLFMRETNVRLQRRANGPVLPAVERELPGTGEVENRVSLFKDDLAGEVGADFLPRAVHKDEEGREAAYSDQRLHERGYRHHPRSLGWLLPLVVRPDVLRLGSICSSNSLIRPCR